MSTTCQAVYASARELLGRRLIQIPTTYEILARLRSEQETLFAEMAGATRGRFQTSEALTSTSGSSGRTLDLSTLTSPLARLLKVALADGTEVNQVDVLDTDAELAPRYYVQGLTLHEVSNDWSPTSGTITATITYVYGPTDLDPTGALTQTVTVPDTWVDLLSLPLAKWLATRVDASAPVDPAPFDAMLSERRAAWLTYCQQYAGVETQRFLLPTAGEAKKR